MDIYWEGCWSQGFIAKSHTWDPAQVSLHFADKGFSFFVQQVFDQYNVIIIPSPPKLNDTKKYIMNDQSSYSKVNIQ